MIANLRVALVAATLVALTLVLLPPQLVARRLGHPLARRIPRLWHRVACRVAGLRIRLRGTPPPRGRPALIVANHSSWADIMALGSLGELAFVAKAEVRDWPLFGWLARLQHCVFVDRADRSGAGRQANAMAERLASGEAMVLFAEGTTSDGNEVRPFNSSLFGAAEAALRAGDLALVEVWPVSVAYLAANGLPLGRYGRPLTAWTGDLDLLPHLLAFLREGAVDVEISVGEPLPFTAGTRRKAVAREAEARVRAMFSDSLAEGVGRCLPAKGEPARRSALARPRPPHDIQDLIPADRRLAPAVPRPPAVDANAKD